MFNSGRLENKKYFELKHPSFDLFSQNSQQLVYKLFSNGNREPKCQPKMVGFRT